ncbi:MAG TPA: GNAT family N-acetyltransferase [Albitalea sp.]|uniref:GNAT family N-acetyltransferase n=1 Tax=Piscinibacter sp. TaxID=1903157 RepID=UPI002ED20D5B
MHATSSTPVGSVPLNGLRPLRAPPLAVTIRPIRKSDFELEKAFVQGLSANTGYQRLMSPRTPSDEELRRWTDVDPSREAALIATTVVDGRETQMGVARYVVVDETGVAEFAIVLGDRWQGRGLGRELLSRLVDAAQQSGVTRLFGTTLSDNGPMLALARRQGFRARREAGSAFITMLTLDMATS